jgi:predicted TIM-barrel fold metal-dependent hydrolase
MISRRELLGAAVAPLAMARPKGTLIETHVHLFAGDPARFPYSPLSYKPPTSTVEDYVTFARTAALDRAVIVHPEPYQDDHRYLEYCFSKEPSKGFFKGTCLFDPIDLETPRRMAELMRRNPGRIVALRIHVVHAAGTPSTTSGLISNRDLMHPRMAETWKAVRDLGLFIQVQLTPHWAEQLGELAARFQDLPLILDHLGRPKQGTPEEFEQVLKLAELPRVYMKYTSTGVEAASNQAYPHEDARTTVRRVFRAFGADRMMWGGLGASVDEFDKAEQLFEAMFGFLPEADRAKIRGLTAMRLFGLA